MMTLGVLNNSVYTDSYSHTGFTCDFSGWGRLFLNYRGKKNIIKAQLYHQAIWIASQFLGSLNCH